MFPEFRKRGSPPVWVVGGYVMAFQEQNFRYGKRVEVESTRLCFDAQVSG